MSRVERPRSRRPGAQPGSRPELSVASAMTSLYRHWVHAGRELERLSSCITRQRFDDGLRTLERACALIRVADELVELVAPGAPSAGEHIGVHIGVLGEAELLRRDLLAEVLPWLEEARRELPAAAMTLCTFVDDPQAEAAVMAAVRQLDELCVAAPDPARRRTGS